ncbi:MAG: inorganic phosphate transporter [Candidatus Omnitrophica bacterium]|nr:inorganic phosphate transporter [Candidatus Omnitrophota bacterium]
MNLILLLVAVLFLAYTNGANDNFKGVATLFGSRTASYRQALAWATVTTFAGSLTALWLSGGLIRVFSGKGLVPAALTTDPSFLLAVGLGASFTVFLATMTGFPISTTHALTGALVGAGWMAAGPQINLGKLGQSFFLPLAASPILSLGLTTLLYPTFRRGRERVGVTKQLCLCVGPVREPVIVQQGGAAILSSTGARLTVGELSQCVEQYQGVLLGIDAQRVLDFLHYLSAGAVSFARGLNDTPKIVALLIAAQALHMDARASFFLVGAAMAVGGILSARRVARTMSERITSMNHGQGFSANLVTSVLVILASRLGTPVSTTHVSCGALFGIGLANGAVRRGMVQSIILSWLITLPLAACLGAALYRFF